MVDTSSCDIEAEPAAHPDRRKKDRRRNFSRPYEILTRISLPLLSIIYGWVILISPTFFEVAIVVLPTEEAVTWSLWFMSGLFGLLILDVIINDVLPERFRFKAADSYRDYLWMAAGLTQILYAALMFHNSRIAALGVPFLLMGEAAVFIAFLEAKRKNAVDRRTAK